MCWEWSFSAYQPEQMITEALAVFNEASFRGSSHLLQEEPLSERDCFLFLGTANGA
jgi:hypothetical protein